MGRLLERYRELDTDPRAFSLDAGSARLILLALFAVAPGLHGREAVSRYMERWRKLVRCISGEIMPVALSLTIDVTLLEELLEEHSNSPQYGLLERMFREETANGDAPISDWTVQRPIAPPPGGSAKRSQERMSRTAVFCFQPWMENEGGQRVWSRRLSDLFGGDPMTMLSVLTAAQRGGILQDAQMAFRLRDRDSLLGLEALSDGELMWLARMGLVLMSRSESSMETLFLLDEPDVHFNDEWNTQFISLLHDYGSGLYHEFLIATHSTLVLTDARREQTCLFAADEHGNIHVTPPPMSPFAAEQDEVSVHLFSAGAIGSYAQETVTKALQNAGSPEELKQMIGQTGPGYQRFQLYERYYEMRREAEEKE